MNPVAAAADHAAARCPFYRARWHGRAPADPAPLAAADVAASAAAGDDPYGGLLADDLTPGALFAAYHVPCAGTRLLLAATDGDLAADRVAAAAVLTRLGLGPHALLLLAGRNAEAYPNRLWLAAAQAMGALNTTADAFATDAWRVRFVTERFRPAILLGLSRETWGALATTDAERFALLAAYRTVVADDDVPAAPSGPLRWARRVTLAGFPCIEDTPGAGYLPLAGRLHLEVAAGTDVLETGAGELLVTTVAREATPLVRLRTGLSAVLARAGAAQVFTLTGGPR